MIKYNWNINIIGSSIEISDVNYGIMYVVPINGFILTKLNDGVIRFNTIGDNLIIDMKWEEVITPSSTDIDDLILQLENLIYESDGAMPILGVNQIAYGNSTTGELTSNSLFVIDSSGNVGIGTNTPVTKLHITGSILTEGLRSNDIAIGTYTFWTSLSNEIQTNFNGTGKHLLLQFSNAGYVGIGTDTPISPLNIRGANNKSQFINQSIDGSGHISIFSYSQGNQQIYFDAVYDNGTIAKHNKSFAIVNFDGQLRFQGNQGLTTDVAFSYDNILVLDIATRGVGIGGNGLIPTSRLDVVGNTDSLNQFRLREGVSFTGTHNNGDIWNDTDKNLKFFGGRSINQNILTQIWKQFNNTSHIINTTEVSILSTVAANFRGNRTLTSNFYGIGSSLKLNINGSYTATDLSTLSLRVYIGATLLTTLNIPVLLNTATNFAYKLNVYISHTATTTIKVYMDYIYNIDDVYSQIYRQSATIGSLPIGLIDVRAVTDLATNSYILINNYSTINIE